MGRRIKIYLLFLFTANIITAKAQIPAAYNVVWNSQSKNASESMPCGGGDIGMNVWVQDGDILIYANRSGSLNEDNNLMKAGRLRIKCFPNPFNGKVFKQELHLQNGYVTVDGESNGVKASVKIWVDVFNPMTHFEISANKKIEVEAAYESWRYQDRLITKRENFSNSWKWAPPADKKYTKDEIGFSTGGILFYHLNGERTIFDTTVVQQGMNIVKEQLYNPLKNLAWGGLLRGDNFIAEATSEGMYEQTDFKAWKLKSKAAAKNHQLQLVLHTATANSFADWHQSLKSVLINANEKNAFAKTQQWWQQFWNRSFIAIDKNNINSKPWELGRNYQLFRYMLACNAKGFWPTKFNGGLLTVDPLYTDAGNKGLTPDYRNWGGGLHTMQNQRLVYFPMIKSGDWDMLQPQFKFYLRILKNAELRSKVYWNHGGACFTEQMENFGLPNFAEYGTRRPADFDKGVEFNAWLEYEWDTVLEFCLMMLEENKYTGKDISDKIPFIESCLRFFDEHYQYLAKQRGAKALDGNGKLVLYPGSGAETFKMAYNSTSTIAALKTITNRTVDFMMNKMTGHNIDTSFFRRSKYLVEFYLRIPDINYQTFNGHTTIAPAKNWERVNNTESTQLYPVFPWGIYGVGKPGLDTAINTWKYDTLVNKFRSHIGWKQDNIWAARLGLTDEAWQLTSLKLQNSERRFPAFWGPGFDWVPDHNWGGSGMIGLQEMLLQTADKRILLFPAWPKDKDVHFKLHAPYNTIVEAEWKDGKMTKLIVIPEERKKDVELMLQ
ncbi:DUF5703 domain-containing protein [Ferruginibacter sp.]|nr:hypothetical protein [Ferruginibacter sp.]